VIALLGELGAGKTTLVHGLAAALGIAGPVPSPTFVLVREYEGRVRLVHVDAYRLADADEALAIGLDEHLPGDGVTAVEWAERVAELLPEEALTVALEVDGLQRRATLSGPEMARWLAEAEA
jgi:tRNA threonylcarbamoyladenosine biosynthesis protein TsaE